METGGQPSFGTAEVTPALHGKPFLAQAHMKAGNKCGSQTMVC